MRYAFRLRNPKNRGAYITIEDAYRDNPTITGYQLYDRKGRRLGDATPDQIKQAADASARGDVREVVLAGNIPFGEVAKILVGDTEYLVG
jgi:hypothetical protein